MLIMLGMSFSPMVISSSFFQRLCNLWFLIKYFLLDAAQNNYCAVGALWAPVLMVCMLYILVMFTYIDFFTCSDISVYHVIFNTGLFHGHSNLVCNLLNFVWWHCWSL